MKDSIKYSHSASGCNGECCRLKGLARTDKQLDEGNNYSDQDMLATGLNQREPFDNGFIFFTDKMKMKYD